MPNIGAMLKQEITRLARREVRVQVQATKKASTQYRRHIAALRRQVTALERQLATLRRRGTTTAPAATGDAPQKIRFVAKGLKSQRARLGLRRPTSAGSSGQRPVDLQLGARPRDAARRPARDTGAARHGKRRRKPLEQPVEEAASAAKGKRRS
jgi:hypothetical protein